MHWIIYCTDKPDSLSLREAHIARHRAYLETTPIKVVMSGPLMDDAGEKMNGSFFLVEAESRGEVESFNRNDPFFDLGLWSAVHIHRFYKRVG
jgi:uncharacterized protein YciI